MIDPLERRSLLADAFITDGVLHVVGGSGEDEIHIDLVANQYHLEVTGEFEQDFSKSIVTAGFQLEGGGNNDKMYIGLEVLLPATLNGGDGGDILQSGGGRATLIGDIGNDTLLMRGPNPNQAFGGDGDDILEGGPGKDQLTGGAGNDYMLGNGGRDLIDGGFGTNTLSGGSKNDTLSAGFGTDFLVGSAGLLDVVSYSGNEVGVHISLDGTQNDGPFALDNIADTCEGFIGGLGNDFIRGSGKPNLIVGDESNDTLLGGGGNDTITGGPGNDSIEGQGGADAIFARETLFAEKDTVIGGSGKDTADTDSIDVVSSVP